MDGGSRVADGSKFIGRADELVALGAALERARSGSTTVVLVRGEAGIGKTRLLEELARLADVRLMPVAWGRTAAVEGAPPFWPWREVLRARSLGGDDRAPATGEDRFVLFEQLCDRLTEDADGRGLVVVLEDLHWADLASLHLLHHLAERHRDSRVLVAGSIRRPATVAGDVSDLLLTIGRLSNATTLDLPGFDAAAIHTQLVDLLGQEPGATLIERLVTRTNGNPLFVRELGRVLRAGADGEGSTIPDTVPDAIRLVIGQRLDQLSPTTRATAAVAAVVGSDIDPELVARLTGQPTDAVLDQLDEAASIGIVVAPKHSGKVRFTHDLMRDTLEDEHRASALARLHLQIADELEASGHDRPAEIAHHRLAALPVGDPDVAVDAASTAAARAMEQLAFEDAAALYRRALEVRVTPAAEPRRADLLVDAARALHLSHDLPGAMDACRESARLARAAGDAEALAHAALLLHDVTEAGWTDEIEPWIIDALAALPADDSSLRARLLAMLAGVRVFTTGDGCEELSAEALAIAERLGDTEALLAAYRGRQLARSGLDGIDDRLDLAERMLALGRERAIDDAIVWGHLWRLDVAIERGRLADAEAELHLLDGLARRMRKPHIGWHVDRGWTGLWLAQGRFRDALEHASAAKSMPMIMAVTNLTGDRLPAEIEAEVFVVAPTPFAAVQRLSVAEYALVTGRRDRAAALYADVPFPGTVPHQRFLTMPITTFHLSVAIGLDDRPAVEACYELLLPYRAFHVVGGAGAIITLGSMEVPLGRAARFLGRPDDAIAHLRAGRTINLDAGLVPFAAEGSLHLGSALLDTGVPAAIPEALALLDEAGEVAERLGMKPLAAAVARASATAPSTVAPPADPLSAREREIAALVADGLTNKQIASSAHISERTAENHVQHILTKLGFNTRSQIAVWFTQQPR